MISRRKKQFFHRVQKFGNNGRAVYLPKEYCDNMKIIKGDMVMITDNRDGTLSIEKPNRVEPSEGIGGTTIGLVPNKYPV